MSSLKTEIKNIQPYLLFKVAIVRNEFLSNLAKMGFGICVVCNLMKNDLSIYMAFKENNGYGIKYSSSKITLLFHISYFQLVACRVFDPLKSQTSDTDLL